MRGRSWRGHRRQACSRFKTWVIPETAAKKAAELSGEKDGRESEGSDEWWRFDDDVVTEGDTAAILDLKGGGDWHTAYLNFYRIKDGNAGSK